MSTIGVGLGSSIVGMQRFVRQAAEAAERIARAGLGPEPPVVPPSVEPGSSAAPAEPAPVDLADSMVTLMLAHRLFTANVRAAQTANRMLGEAVDLPARSDGPR